MSCCDDTDAWMKRYPVPVVNLVAVAEAFAQAYAEGKADQKLYAALRRAIENVKR